MNIGKKLWQMLAFVMVVAMLVGSLPAAIASARSEAIVSSTVNGRLDEQYAKHYLELRVTDQTKAVRLVMDYNPQDRQELDNGAGFSTSSIRPAFSASPVAVRRSAPTSPPAPLNPPAASSRRSP
ncbi:MAG: hypothetical protein R2873_19065 [Caldilineaceae bacterium]